MAMAALLCLTSCTKGNEPVGVMPQPDQTVDAAKLEAAIDAAQALGGTAVAVVPDQQTVLLIDDTSSPIYGAKVILPKNAISNVIGDALLQIIPARAEDFPQQTTSWTLISVHPISVTIRHVNLDTDNATTAAPRPLAGLQTEPIKLLRQGEVFIPITSDAAEVIHLDRAAITTLDEENRLLLLEQPALDTTSNVALLRGLTRQQGWFGAIEAPALGLPEPFEPVHPITDTGVSDCYNNIDIIECTDSGPFLGQDAHIQTTPLDVTQNTSTKIVYDNVTRLRWFLPPSSHAVVWSVADQTCQELAVTGITGWRLPSVTEWVALLDYRDGNELRSGPLLTWAARTYWTQEVGPPNGTMGAQGDALTVALSVVGAINPKPVDDNLATVCVQSDEAPVVDPAIRVHDDGTLTDLWTGLRWQYRSGPPTVWEVALAYCQDLSMGGRTDWLLPDIKQLVSARHALGPDAPIFDEWSSTTRPMSPHVAFLGSSKIKYKDQLHPVRCVALPQ